MMVSELGLHVIAKIEHIFLLIDQCIFEKKTPTLTIGFIDKINDFRLHIRKDRNNRYKFTPPIS